MRHTMTPYENDCNHAPEASTMQLTYTSEERNQASEFK